MRLVELLDGLEYKIINGSENIDVTNVEYDSRKVAEGSAFVCIRGYASDGHRFIAKAAAQKASLVVVDQDMEYCKKAVLEQNEKDSIQLTIPESLTIVQVKDSRIALAIIAANFYEHPAKKLTVIGLTGTKGKTTTAHMIKYMLEGCGYKTGMIGTVGVYDGETLTATGNTTPESLELHKYFAAMVKNGCTHVVMEVSSQAFKLHRVEGVHYNVSAFINISPDHIGPNEHADFEEYLACKSEIFGVSDICVVNADDEKVMGSVTDCIARSGKDIFKRISLSGKENVNLIPKSVEDVWEESCIGSKVAIAGDMDAEMIVPLPGMFNVENALVACEILAVLGCDAKAMAAGMKLVKVKGRTQVINEASPICTYMVDFAHNSVSLEATLTMLKRYNPGKLICIFGCGGNRAKTRRYDMGEVSGKYADLSIITEDNPRLEKLEDIVEDILVGMSKTDGEYKIIYDREEALKYAMDIAGKDDIVVTCGKGHETYQDRNGKKTYFCEEEIIIAYAKEKLAK